MVCFETLIFLFGLFLTFPVDTHWVNKSNMNSAMRSACYLPHDFEDQGKGDSLVYAVAVPFDSPGTFELTLQHIH